MKHKMRSLLLIICSSLVIGLHAESRTMLDRTTQKQVNDIVGRIKNVVTRAGTATDGTNPILEAILACVYQIKFDHLIIIAPKLCAILSQLDGIEFTIVDSIGDAGQSLAFTICDKMSDIDSSLGFTICDKLENAMYSLQFTIVDTDNMILESLGFTICDKVLNLGEGLEFTIVDQAENAAASIAFTVCDKISTPVINIPALGFTVCDTVGNTQASLGFTLCDKTEIIAEDTSSVLEKVCSALDIISAIAQDPDFNSLRFTICDKAETITSKLDEILCPVIIITEDSFGGDNIFELNQSGANYCLAEDISSPEFEIMFVVSADDICFDMNDRKFEGTIQIQGDRVEVRNGKICPPAPTESPSSAAVIFNTTLKSSLENCIIQCANTATEGEDGRTAIEIVAESDQTRIVDCYIQAGGALSANSVMTISGNGISNAGTQTRILNCDIQAGNGMTGGTGVSGAPGGHGIFNSNTSANTCIFDCKIAGGDGSSASDGFAGGHGILVDNSINTVIRRCFVTHSGNSGDSVMAPATDGGDGIQISSASINTEVRNCIVACTGSAGTGISGVSRGGRAIEDLVPTSTSVIGASVIADNFAFKITDTLVRYNIHATGTEGGVDSTLVAPENGDNVFLP